MTRTLSDRAALLLAQWFGCGRSRWAPGTMGALGTLPLYWLLRTQSAAVYALACLLVLVLGVWASERAAGLLGEKDPQSVVIDEVIGTLLALGFVRGQLPFELAAWVLFRLFDITKPGLIDRAQHLKPAGVGIMADDVLAGLVAGSFAYAGALGYIYLLTS